MIAGGKLTGDRASLDFGGGVPCVVTPSPSLGGKFPGAFALVCDGEFACAFDADCACARIFVSTLDFVDTLDTDCGGEFSFALCACTSASGAVGDCCPALPFRDVALPS